jgi:uncharacterized membrane protein
MNTKIQIATTIQIGMVKVANAPDALELSLTGVVGFVGAVCHYFLNFSFRFVYNIS